MAIQGRHKRWHLRELPPLDRTPCEGLSPLLRVVLFHRGLRTDLDARRFLNHELDGDHDPSLLPGVSAAVHRLILALRRDEVIAIYGDYDVDGMTGTALLARGLRDHGARVITHIPDRFRDGYGLTPAGVRMMRERGAQLLVSVDCGITSVAEVALARELGLDVVIVDHHKVPDVLPDAAAWIDPKAPGSPYPFTELTSVGVVYKLLTALAAELGRPFDAEGALDLVALGTIADVAPLVGENRHLVSRGLAALTASRRPGLRALVDVAGLRGRQLRTDDVSFALAPRINAAGRIASAGTAFDLLTTGDELAAANLAGTLDGMNRERQRQTEAAMAIANELLDAEPADVPLLFVADPRLSQGIVGLVAGRLTEQFYRPSVVCEIGEATSRASARSIPEFDITAALTGARDDLLRFGGHRQAAGFTAETARLGRIKERLVETAAAQLASVDLAPTILVDARLRLARVKGEDIAALGRLQPFGAGNPEPVFLSRGVEVRDARPVGDGSHHRLKLRDGAITWSAMAFRAGWFEAYPDRLDIVYSVRLDSRSDLVELQVHDMARPEEPAAARL